MGKKTKNPASGPGGRKQKFWCYYCGAESKDEGTLIQHQAAKHFACPFCDVGAFGRLCQSLSGLVSHVRRSHRRELDKVPGAMPGRESTEVDVYAMNGIPADVMEAARQTDAGDDDDDAPPPPPKNNSSAPAPQIFSTQVSSGGGNSDGQQIDNITQALAGAASDSTSPMAKALLAAVATNSPATAGDTDNIIKAVLRAATTPKADQKAAAPQMSMPSMPMPSMPMPSGGGSMAPSEGMRPGAGLLGLAKAPGATGQMGGLLGAKELKPNPAFPGMSMNSGTPSGGGNITPSEGMMGSGGLLGGNLAKASAITGQMGGLLGAQSDKEKEITNKWETQLALATKKPEEPSNSWGSGSGYSSLGLPQPPRSSGGGGGGGSSSWSLSLADSRPMSLGMPSGSGHGSTISNKEEKPPPFPTRAEFRKALQEEERKAELARWRPGDLVELKGLVNNGKLNGAEGTVVSIHPDVLMTVKVQITENGKQYCVRPQNMIKQYGTRGGDNGKKEKKAKKSSSSNSSSTSSTRSKKRRKEAKKAEKEAKKAKKKEAIAAALQAAAAAQRAHQAKAASVAQAKAAAASGPIEIDD